MTTSPAWSQRRSIPRAATTSTTEAGTTATAVAEAGGSTNSGLDDTDHAIAAQSIAMETALRDLLRAAGGDETMMQLAAAHEAFATRIAGIAGIPATTVDEDFKNDRASAFSSDAITATMEAEFDAAERYVAWMRQISDGRLIAAFSSISIAESRQGALVAMGSGLQAALDGATGVGS